MVNLAYVSGVALIIEVITLILRLGFGLTSKHVQDKLRMLIRVHHMYIGALIMIIGATWSPSVVPCDDSKS